MRKNGLLIAIEGIDGSGKSSLAKALKTSLEKLGRNVVLTQEPGATKLGKKLRTILHEEKESLCDKAEFLLFAANRAQHFEELVIPALEKGNIVISDRMADSSVAYQGYGRGLDIEKIMYINSWAMNGIEPDLVFYLKIDQQTAMQRITSRGETLTSFEKEKELFWKKVSEGYEELFKSKRNVITLDSNLSIDNLCKIVTTTLKKETE